MSRNRLPFLSAVAALPLLGGCAASGDVRPYAEMAPIVPVVAYVEPATAGAIYQAGPGMSLYGDRKAREVGDLLTITLVENTSAQTSATTAVSKSSEIGMAAPTLFGSTISDLDASVSGERDFSGNGRSAQSNRLQGNVTVTVTQRLPNGNLVVQGQKNIRLNQGNELVQIQGIVRPSDISPDNTILSSRVADARIVYGGRGALAQSNSMGWLGRFFNSRLMPY